MFDLNKINFCKTKEEVFRIVNNYNTSSLSPKQNKYYNILLFCLKKSKSLGKSLQYVYNYYLGE